MLLLLLANVAVVDVCKRDPGLWPVTQATEKTSLVPSGKIELFASLAKRQLSFTELRPIARLRSEMRLMEATISPAGIVPVLVVVGVFVTSVASWSLWSSHYTQRKECAVTC